MSYSFFKTSVLSLSILFLNIAIAGGTQKWANVSDVLAIGLPLVATGKAVTSGDANDIKDLTFSLGTELVQYILDCGWDFNRNSMGDTGRLVSEVVFLGLGLVDRCGNSVL